VIYIKKYIYIVTQTKYYEGW